MNRGFTCGAWDGPQYGKQGLGLAPGVVGMVNNRGIQVDTPQYLDVSCPELLGGKFVGAMGDGRQEAWVGPTVGSHANLRSRSRSRSRVDRILGPHEKHDTNDIANKEVGVVTDETRKIEQIEMRIGKMEQEFDEFLKITKQVAKKQGSECRKGDDSEEKSWEAPRAPR